MLKVIEFKPHVAASLDGNQLTLTFARGQLSVEKDGECYDFVPYYQQKIEVLIDRNSVTNIADIFLLQKKDRAFKVTVQGLMRMSDIADHLQKMIRQHQIKEQEHLIDLFEAIEEMNVNALIDRALAEGNKELFLQLTERQTEEML